MDRYIPTGNEMISLPKINESTAAIEDFTYLSMQHKGLIEVRGGQTLPLIVPFVRIDDCDVPLSGTGSITGFLRFLPRWDCLILR